MLKSSKKKIISAISGLVVCSTMLVFALTSYAWFAANDMVESTGIQIMVDGNNEEQIIFNFDLFIYYIIITDFDF